MIRTLKPGGDPQRSVWIDRSQSRAYLAITLAAARQARTSPRAPSRNPPFRRDMLTNLAGGFKKTAPAVPRRPLAKFCSAHHRLYLSNFSKYWSREMYV